MQQRSSSIATSSIPIATGEWVVQWSNTINRGSFERVPDATFGSHLGLV